MAEVSAIEQFANVVQAQSVVYLRSERDPNWGNVGIYLLTVTNTSEARVVPDFYMDQVDPGVTKDFEVRVVQNEGSELEPVHIEFAYRLHYSTEESAWILIGEQRKDFFLTPEDGSDIGEADSPGTQADEIV